MDRSIRTNKYNLKILLEKLVANFQGIEELYIFGSRAYGTGSLRSDCDIIVRVAKHINTKSSDLRDFAISNCSALDFFLCPEARAVSCANDSFVYASTFDELVDKLDAIRLWTRLGGFTDFSFIESGNWVFETGIYVYHAASNLPDTYVGDQAWYEKLRSVEAEGLPVRPFIGDTLPKAVAQICEIARAMIFSPSQLGQRGEAKCGWTVNLQSEYDCQNLFFTVIKPWLPGLAKEEVEIYFDGQAKIADFSLFNSKLVIEMKFIDRPTKKNEVSKTISGLKNFYIQNGNIRFLLFIIYVKGDVDIDGPRWEAEFTFMTSTPRVITMVIAVP
ncbi:hypothetical protein M2322_003342 [Rhodoblastus acidophilus]|uniref:PD-(D/E)XK nuclease domain-containing protein n=1 Tax=Rhodoblastus acidophilus TaxID=1074 RepID=UPI0022248984|nr:nucleotidyltransferase domain-containing protein [Rhodoblastus acidophilus]MCW2317777.1 hypothetical protein [Rhodoblastus acidophilus]